MIGTARERSSTALTLRNAALVAGFTYLLSPAACAEYLYRKLVVSGDIEHTLANITAHRSTFLAAFLAYFAAFIGDIVMAWALYYLLAPVHRALTLLMVWFQVVYAAMVLCGTISLGVVIDLLTAPQFLAAFGAGPLHAQIKLLLDSFRTYYEMGLVLFGIHLVLLGYLVFRSQYIPKFIGILLAINGLGWIADSLQPYLLPDVHLRFLFATFFGEIVFMFWLLIRGWKIPEPAAA